MVDYAKGGKGSKEGDEGSKEGGSEREGRRRGVIAKFLEDASPSPPERQTWSHPTPQAPAPQTQAAEGSRAGRCGTVGISPTTRGQIAGSYKVDAKIFGDSELMLDASCAGDGAQMIPSSRKVSPRLAFLPRACARLSQLHGYYTQKRQLQAAEVTTCFPSRVRAATFRWNKRGVPTRRKCGIGANRRVSPMQ